MLLGLVNELPGCLGTGYREGTAPSLSLVFVASRAIERPCRVKEGSDGML